MVFVFNLKNVLGWKDCGWYFFFLQKSYVDVTKASVQVLKENMFVK